MDKTVAEFFAGIGLMRLGLEQAGWHVAWANDIEVDKKSLYEGNFGADDFVLEDVHRIKADTLPSVALATASFPCTDLSLAGGRRGLAGSGSSAFWGFVKTIEAQNEKRPPLILLENVTGFLTSNGGSDFREACMALNRLGYTLDPFIIDAAHFVPQSRQRLFVVGTRLPMTKAAKDPRIFYQDECRPRKLAEFILWHPEIQWSIRPLPKYPKSRKTLSDILEDLPAKSPVWWEKNRAAYLLDQMSPRHREIANRMIDADEVSHGTVFRRVRKGKSMAELRTDGIAGCLRTPRGGSGRQILFEAGKSEYRVRLLTARECARLMGADDFVITPKASLNKALFGFGDAVCVPVVKWIARHYLNPLLKELERREYTEYGEAKPQGPRSA